MPKLSQIEVREIETAHLKVWCPPVSPPIANNFPLTVAIRQGLSAFDWRKPLTPVRQGQSRGLHYHASSQTQRAIVLRHDNKVHTIIDVSTGGTDILIDQCKID